MPHISKSYVDTSFGQVHYRTTEPRTPRLPLVLFHQTASSSVMYEALMEEMGDELWMFAPDTPGFGGTFFPPPKPSVQYYARVLYESLHAVGITQCWMFGQHTGASIAVQMIHDHPKLVQKLVLSGPPYLSPAEKEVWTARTSPMVIDRNGGHLPQIWERIHSRDPNAPVDLIHREAVLNLHAGERYHEAYLAAFEHDFATQLSEIECPVLLLAGEFDTLRSSLEPAGDAVKNGIIREILGATTYVCDREAKLLAKMIREFLLNWPCQCTFKGQHGRYYV